MKYSGEHVGRIRSRIEAAGIEQGLSEQAPKDSGFHMLDWIEDLERLVAFYENPDEYSNEQVDDLLMDFLIHAPNHLAAAAKLYADYPVSDLFGVGAI
jgi:hypothetical protein